MGDSESGALQVNTLVIRNIPGAVSLDALKDAVESVCSGDRFDALYVPFSGRPEMPPVHNMNYAFINFPDPRDAAQFAVAFTGFRFSALGSRKVIGVEASMWQGIHEMFKLIRTASIHRLRLPIVRGAVAKGCLARAMRRAARNAMLHQENQQLSVETSPSASTRGPTVDWSEGLVDGDAYDRNVNETLAPQTEQTREPDRVGSSVLEAPWPATIAVQSGSMQWSIQEAVIAIERFGGRSASFLAGQPVSHTGALAVQGVLCAAKPSDHAGEHASSTTGSVTSTLTGSRQTIVLDLRPGSRFRASW